MNTGLRVLTANQLNELDSQIFKTVTDYFGRRGISPSDGAFQDGLCACFMAACHLAAAHSDPDFCVRLLQALAAETGARELIAKSHGPFRTIIDSLSKEKA
jgi:hypothetical protein